MAGKAASEGGANPAADRAEARAKAEGATGPHGPDAKRSLRDSAIVARAATGVAHKDIGDEFGVSPRIVRAVVARARKTRSVLDTPAMELIEGLLRSHRRDEADLRHLAYVHCESNPYVCLNALKGAREALDRSVALLSDLGKLPKDLWAARGEAELVRVAELICGKLEDVMAGGCTAADAKAYFDYLMTPDTPLWDRPEDRP